MPTQKQPTGRQSLARRPTPGRKSPATRRPATALSPSHLERGKQRPRPLVPHKVAYVMVRLGGVLLAQRRELEGHRHLVVLLDSRGDVQRAALREASGVGRVRGVCGGQRLLSTDPLGRRRAKLPSRGASGWGCAAGLKWVAPCDAPCLKEEGLPSPLVRPGPSATLTPPAPNKPAPSLRTSKGGPSRSNVGAGPQCPPGTGEKSSSAQACSSSRGWPPKTARHMRSAPYSRLGWGSRGLTRGDQV
jgi:hypothetical protein